MTCPFALVKPPQPGCDESPGGAGATSVPQGICSPLKAPEDRASKHLDGWFGS